MLSIKDFSEARERISNVVFKTPLKKSGVLSQKEYKVYLKMENLQETGSFKIRGAYNFLSLLKKRGNNFKVVASSAGNHAQGVAYSSKLLGFDSLIVMPENTPKIKVQKTKDYGSKILLYGNSFDDAFAKAKEIEEKEGWIFVHAFDDEQIIAGQASIAFEILEELEDADTVIVPIGGGGLIAGIACLLKLLKNNTRVIGVQPRIKRGMLAALERGEPYYLDEDGISIADGTSVKKVGSITLEYVKKYVDQIVLLNEDEIKKSIMLLAESERIIVEGAGALAVGAIEKIEKKNNEKIVCILSGANIDNEVFINLFKEYNK